MVKCGECHNEFYEHSNVFHKTDNENEYHCLSCCINFIEPNEPIFCPNKNCINNVMGIDGLVKCTNCGNVWDGFAQCTCWQDEVYFTEDTENLTQDTEPYVEELEEQFQQLEDPFNENEIKPPKLVRQNAVIFTQ